MEACICQGQTYVRRSAVAAAGERGIHVPGVDQRTPCARVGSQGGRDVRQVRQHGAGAPMRHQLVCRLLGILLALGDDADEVAHHDHGDQPGDVGHGRLVDAEQAVPEHRPGIDATVRWPHHPAVQHAGHAHVVHVDQSAGGLCCDVGARHGLPDDAVVAGGFDRCRRIQLYVEAAAAQQLGVAGEAIACRADHPVRYAQLGRIHAKRLGRQRHQRRTGLGSGGTQRRGGHLQGGARDGGALVRTGADAAQHGPHPAHVKVQLLRHDLRQRGADPGAEVDMAVERDRTRRIHHDEDLGPRCSPAQHDERVALGQDILRSLVHPKPSPHAAPPGRSRHGRRSGTDCSAGPRGFVPRSGVARAAAGRAWS